MSASTKERAAESQAAGAPGETQGRQDVRRAFRGDVIAPMLLGGLIIGLVGGAGALLGQPCLFPSLGPTVFLQVVTPGEMSAQRRNIWLGHGVGLACGFLALFLFGAQQAPPALGADTLAASRIAATSLAISLTLGLQLLLDARHPPAAATTMLITLGGFKPQWNTLIILALGVGLVASLGEIARRWRLSQLNARRLV